MGIFRLLTDIFESIFMGSSPEVKKRQALHKIDIELRSIQPLIFKGGLLQPNLAELFRILYENTKPIDDILSMTISGDDIKRNNHYENQLLLTGFTGTSQEKLEKLTAEKRKQEVLDSDLPMTRVFENQKHTLEFLIKELNTPEFIKIDEVISGLQQLTDICRFNFLSIIHSFDPSYSPLNPDKQPVFAPCIPDTMASSFQDLYYLTASFKISSAMGHALVALVQMEKGDSFSEKDTSLYLGYLKKINTVFSKFLNEENLLKLIRIAKRDPDFIPQKASYKANSRQKFATFMQEKFIADESRIKTEIKDNTISLDLKTLFGGNQMAELNGYAQENSANIQINSTKSYSWITPLQIIKTFLQFYYTESIKALLNDIVIEGFFDNSQLKSEFSAIVFACNESAELIAKFEEKFGRGGDYDSAVLDGYIKDGHKDADFIKKLESTVDNINEEAHQIVQEICAQFFALYKQIAEILVDSKKTKPDAISNIKVLLSSTRNRESSGMLEQQFDMWTTFLNIMKNYAIIGEVER